MRCQRRGAGVTSILRKLARRRLHLLERPLFDLRMRAAVASGADGAGGAGAGGAGAAPLGGEP